MIIAEATMNVPVGWVLTTMGALALSISSLAALIYKSQNQRINGLEEQIKSVREINKNQADTITSLNKFIENLQKDIDDLKQANVDLKARIKRYEGECGK